MCMRGVLQAEFRWRLFTVTSAILHEICLILMDYSVFVMETNNRTRVLLSEKAPFESSEAGFTEKKRNYP
ncbi:hypothetical protein Pan241w_05140 [Gimesia alba]|uniref:Uncharacterized protein n=1 Tax=Gimesia alba TaxID=2527973 RepID=A0A517R988_9PLAN|nr:hypothetical protein Pan241w_05140 [Gimesia alba]